MVSVAYEEISSAFEFVGSAAPMEHSAYISLDSGKFYWASQLCSMDEEVPDDLDTSDRYLAVPHKTDVREVQAAVDIQILESSASSAA